MTIDNDQTQLATLMKDNMMGTTSTLSSFKNIIDKIQMRNLHFAFEILKL